MQTRDEGVKPLRYKRRVVRTHCCTDVIRSYGEDREVAPVHAIFQETEGVRPNEKQEESAVGSHCYDERVIRVFVDGHALCALAEAIRAEAIVCPALRGVEDDVPRILEMHIKVARQVPILGCNFIGVVLYGQAAEARVQRVLGNVVWHAEVVVGVAGLLEVEVDFVDGEGEVGEVESHEDSPSVLHVSRATGLGFGLTGADEDAVEDGLDP